MLTAGVLKFDEFGRIILSANAPVSFNGGTPVAADGGLSAILGGDPDVFLAGIGYIAPGYITNASNPLIPQAGLLTNDRGQIRASNDMPDHWYAGLPLTVEGRLSISDVIPPIDEGAYNNAFDPSFDIGV